MSFGERLYFSMKRCGYTNYRLAKSMNISESTVGYWVKDKVLPNAKQLIALSKELSVSIDYLLKGEEYTMQEKIFQNSTISGSQIMVDSNGSPVNSTATNDELSKLIQNLSEKDRATVLGFIKTRILNGYPTDIFNNRLYPLMVEFEDVLSDAYWVFLIRILKKSGHDFRNEIINKTMEYCKREKIDIENEINKLYKL